MSNRYSDVVQRADLGGCAGGGCSADPVGDNDGVVGSLYEHDPEMAPDSAFELGRPDHLVVDNDGRLLDARGTRMRVVGLRPELAFFEVEVLAVEDRGARGPPGRRCSSIANVPDRIISGTLDRPIVSELTSSRGGLPARLEG
jgi:hypothetical protein